MPKVMQKGSVFSYQFLRAKAAVAYSVEKSYDLSRWYLHEEITDTHAAVGELVTLPIEESDMDGRKIFLRVVVRAE